MLKMHLNALTFVSLLATITHSVAAGSHGHLSLTKPYLDQDVGSRSWNFGGSTVIDVDSQIRLTPDLPHRSGFIFSKNILPMDSFEIEMEYKIHGSAKIIHGDGMALWLTKEEFRQPGNAMGSQPVFTGLGVMIDTFANSDRTHTYPYVSLMINDGSRVYDHDGDNAATSAGGCAINGRNEDFTTKLKLSYLRGKYLELHTTYDFSGEWRLCARVEQVSLPEKLHLGVTAATGEISNAHDLISLDTRSHPDAHGAVPSPHVPESPSTPPLSSTSQNTPPRYSPPSQPGSVVGTVFKYVAVAGFVATVILAYRTTRGSRSAKHF